MKIKYIFIAVILLLVVFGFANIAKASCLQENFDQKTYTEKVQCLTSIVADLTQQLNSIIAQRNITSVTTGLSWCHTFNTNLGYANSGTDEVGFLHTALQKENISYTPDTGNTYGVPTMTAVTQFQTKYAILPTTSYYAGYVEASTRVKLNALYGCSTTPVACTPNWQCTWGSCVNGYRSQIVIDSNNCGLSASSASIACTALAQTCVSSLPIGCTPTSGYSTVTGLPCGNSTPSITLTSPNGGETWAQGSTHDITWTSTGVSTVTLSLNFGASGVYTIVSNIPASGGFYSWTIPTNISIATQAWLVVSSGLVGDYSNNPFSIVAPGVPVSGVCGLANGVAVSTVPTTNLCLNGTASSSGTGPWTWSCSGVNGGATATCSAPIAVTPTITVTSPNGGETWAQGSTHDITWTSTGVSTVTLSLNFGASGVYTIVSNIPASGGFYSWTIPTNISIATQAWLVVSSGLVGDYSNNPFSIVAPGILPIGCTPTSGYSTVTGLPCGNSTPSITLTSPNGGETLIYGQAYDVTWTSVGIDQIDIELVDMVTNGSARIANNVSASAGTYAWTPNFSVGNYKIRLVYNTNISDSSNNSFSIAGPHTPVNGICGSANGVTVSAVPTANLCLNGTASSVSGTGPWTWSCSGVNGGATATCSSGCSNGSCVQTNVQSSITLTSPNGGEYWLIGMSNNITWQKSADINTVDIKLYYDGSYRTTIATQVTGNSYTWNIPANFSAGYKYKIIIFSGGMQLASSNDYFSIITLGDQPSITVISPNGGENLQMGQTWLVRWVINIPPFDPGYYSIEVYLVNNNTGEKTMIGTHDYASSPFAWVVPTTISDPNFHYGVGSLYKIEVSILRTVQGGLISSDVSNSTFGIIPSTIPSITVVSPNGGERWVIGSRQPITWESTGIDYVRVDLYKAGRFVQNIVAKGFGVGFSGDNLLNMSVAWTVPANLAVSAFSIDRSDDYKIRVSKFGDASIYDESNNNFSIIAP